MAAGKLPWRPDVATNRFRRLCRSVGIAGVRLHDLRHYVATNLGAGGTPIATISARLGHRDRATTLNVYQHALPAQDHQAADLLGALLEPEEGAPLSGYWPKSSPSPSRPSCDSASRHQGQRDRLASSVSSVAAASTSARVEARQPSKVCSS